MCNGAYPYSRLQCLLTEARYGHWLTSAGGTMHHSYNTWACAAPAAVQKAIHTVIQPCTVAPVAAEMRCPLTVANPVEPE